jgi:hypothetical protein
MKNKLSTLSCHPELSDEAAHAGAEVFVVLVLIDRRRLGQFEVGLGANSGGEQGSDSLFAQDHQEQ